MEEEVKKLRKEISDLKKVISHLDKKLSKHIVFIEEVYTPLQKSIDKFKRFFK